MALLLTHTRRIGTINQIIQVYNHAKLAMGRGKQKEINMGVPDRASIKAGLSVAIVQKQDQRSGKLTNGVVADLLTSSPNHPHGIKVRLTTGEVGRVQALL